MFKYAKIKNEETGLCEVGIGTNEAYYQSIGMVQMDVEQSEIDGNWYTAEKCPHSTPQEQADIRRADFESKFFYIEGFGWYRRQPKGYQSAIESLNTAFNNFTVMRQMGVEEFPANVFIFYQAPDFTKPEECTEEWLIAHQTKNSAMSTLEFGTFYTTFTNTWNAEEHE